MSATWALAGFKKATKQTWEGTGSSPTPRACRISAPLVPANGSLVLGQSQLSKPANKLQDRRRRVLTQAARRPVLAAPDMRSRPAANLLQPVHHSLCTEYNVRSLSFSLLASNVPSFYSGTGPEGRSEYRLPRT
nr:unnamed protein product [Spirometra erinaceieuropaei]